MSAAGVGTVWLEGRLSVGERMLIVWRWICSTHTGSGLHGCGGMSLCAFWCCPGYAVLMALFVDFRWSVKISWRMGFLEEGDGDVGVFWSLPSDPLSILNAHFCHTPAADMIE